MEWLNLESESELKKYASNKYEKRGFENLKKQIKKDLGEFIESLPQDTKECSDMIKITARGWKDLYRKIGVFKDIVYKLTDKEVNIKNKSISECSEEDYNSYYFKSSSDELIFYILELSGKKRNEKLGVKESYYKNSDEAKKWRNNILKKIHPDISNNPNASEAIIRFEQLYELISG